MNLVEIHTQILDAIAPANWRELGIKSATLQVTARRIPTLTLECEFLPKTGAGLEEITRLFELWPIPPAPVLAAFDLDAAMRQAQQRVAGCIESSATWHGYVLATKFRVAMKRQRPAAWGGA